MARRKVSPEAQIIALFTGLSEEGKRMVMFGLNAITSNEAPKPPSASAPSAGQKPSRKPAAPKADASNTAPCAAQVPGLDVPCGEPEDALIHDPKGGYTSYHPFVTPAQSVPKRSRQKGAGNSSVVSIDAPPASVGLAAGTSGD